MKTTLSGLNRKKFACSLLILMLIILMAPAWAQDLSGQVQSMSQEVKGQRLSGPVGTLLGSQRMNIEIALNGGEKLIIGVITENKVVMNLQNGAVEKPTLIISIDENTIQEIQTSKDPSEALAQAVLDQKIKYKVKGFFNKIKFKFVSTLLKMASPKAEVEKEAKEAPEAETAAEKEATAAAEETAETAEEEPAEAENETQQEPAEEAEVQDEEAADEELEAETEEAELAGNNLHTVVMDNTGFAVSKINVKVGDTVTWENTRSGSLNGAMVIGARFNCNQAKSKMFKPGESYSYTFDKAGTCVVVDGIFTTAVMNVIVEE